MPTKSPAKRSKAYIRPQRARRVKLAPYRPIRLKPSIKPVRPKLTGSFRLFARTLLLLKKHWLTFTAITLIYALLTVLLVKGLADSNNLTQIKNGLSAFFSGPTGKLSLGLTLFAQLAANSNASGSANAGVYQTLLLIVISLVVIWVLRQIFASSPVHVKEAFYHGPAALIPFILVLLVVGLELIPLVIGAVVYSAVQNGGIAVGGWEKFVWLLIFLMLTTISLYLVCSSLFALYIVTLPDMTPLKALRSARQLVRYRRFLVMRKIVFLPLALVIIGIIIMVPVVLIITPAAAWIFFALSLISLLVIHGYMYSLYRELLYE